MAYKTINEIFELGDVSAFDHPPGMLVANIDLYYGLELEIEDTIGFQATLGFRSHPDGSLRNNGTEFISVPATAGGMEYLLNGFFKENPTQPSNYSERCSTHVHTNCLDLIPEQVASICLLYQVFEKLLYKFVGHDRDTNIFCVPWCETNITYNSINLICTDPDKAMSAWQKYTGLNLQPLTTQGTIEWRHLHGTSDVSLILIWMNLIGSIYAWVRKRISPETSLQETKDFLLGLNTTSQYTQALDTVFGPWADNLKVDNYRLLMEEGVIHAKYSLLKPALKPTNKPELNWDAFDDAFFRAPVLQAEIPHLDIDTYLRMGANDVGVNGYRWLRNQDWAMQIFAIGEAGAFDINGNRVNYNDFLRAARRAGII